MEHVDLMNACRDGDIEKVKTFPISNVEKVKTISSLVDAYEFSDYHYSAPEIASKYGRLNILEYMNDNGIINDKDYQGILYNAIYYGHLDIIKYFFENYGFPKFYESFFLVSLNCNYKVPTEKILKIFYYIFDNMFDNMRNDCDYSRIIEYLFKKKPFGNQVKILKIYQERKDIIKFFMLKADINYVIWLKSEFLKVQEELRKDIIHVLPIFEDVSRMIVEYII